LKPPNLHISGGREMNDETLQEGKELQYKIEERIEQVTALVEMVDRSRMTHDWVIKLDCVIEMRVKGRTEPIHYSVSVPLPDPESVRGQGIAKDLYDFVDKHLQRLQETFAAL